MELTKEEINKTVESITGYEPVNVKASVVDGTLKLEGTLETGKGYSSNSRTYTGKYHLSAKGELLVNKGKYYNMSRGVYMTNWGYTGMYISDGLRGKVSDIELDLYQDLD